MTDTPIHDALTAEWFAAELDSTDIADGTITAYRLGRRNLRVDADSLANMLHPVRVTTADFDFADGER